MTHHHIIRDLAYFLLSIGGLGLGIAYLSSHGFLSGIMHEYPLNPTSMVMDHDKNIYVASEFYGIVQVYTSHGRFKTSFYVPNANGNPFRIRLGSNNVVQVNVENDAKTYCFNTNGEIIKTLPQKISAYEQFTNQQQIITHHTTKYYISPSIFYPKIIKEENNIKHVLIETPRHLMLLQAPFPAWVIWTLGIAFLALSKGDLQKKVFQRRFSCVQIKQTKTQTRIVISQKMKDHMGEISLLILCSILWAYGGYKLSNPIFFKDFSLTRTILYLLLGIIWVLGLRHILLTILWLSCGKEIIFISARKFEIQKEIFFITQKNIFSPNDISIIYANTLNHSTNHNTNTPHHKEEICIQHQKNRYYVGKNISHNDLKTIFLALKKAKFLKPNKFRVQRKGSIWKKMLKEA